MAALCVKNFVHRNTVRGMIYEPLEAISEAAIRAAASRSAGADRVMADGARRGAYARGYDAIPHRSPPIRDRGDHRSARLAFTNVRRRERLVVASLLPALGVDWMALAAKLAVACALILPPSVLLGATFPLMSAGLVRTAHAGNRAALGEPVAMLYFANSLGAAAGVLTSGFVLIAWVGLPGTLRTAES